MYLGQSNDLPNLWPSASPLHCMKSHAARTFSNEENDHQKAIYVRCIPDSLCIKLATRAWDEVCQRLLPSPYGCLSLSQLRLSVFTLLL